MSSDMKTKISTAIIFLILSSACSAQQEVQRVISYSSPLFTSDLKADHSGNILCSFTDQQAGVFIPGILKLDTSFNILWACEQQFPNDAVQGGFDVTQDNGLIVISSYHDSSLHEFGLISRLDSLGHVLWSRIAHSDYSSAPLSAVAAMPSGDFLICGEEGFTTTVIMKVDNAGNILWKERISALGFIVGDQIERANDDGYYISGFVTDSSLQFDGLVMKIDSNGQVLWANNFSEGKDCYASSFETGNDSSYYFTLTSVGYYGSDDTVVLVKAISNVGIPYLNVYYHPNAEQYFNSIALEGNGNVLVAGQSYDSLQINPTWNFTLAEFSPPVGLLNGSFQFDAGYQETSPKILVLPGGSVVMAGWTYAEDPDSSRIYFIKGALSSGNSCNESDYTLIAPPSSFVSRANVNVSISSSSFTLDSVSVPNSFIIPSVQTLCNSIGIEAVKNDETFSVFPNPVQDEFTIQLPDIADDTYSIRLLDATGRIVRTQTLISRPLKSDFQI